MTPHGESIGFGRPFTRTDLLLLPEDGRRPEVVDGVLIVTPSPTLAHQKAVAELAMLLDDACPEELEAVLGPIAVVLADDTELRPDVVVARRDGWVDEYLPGAPELAVEVQLPCTEVIDGTLKRRRHERAGTRAYWVFDPAKPRLTAWELGPRRRYRQVANVTGAQRFETKVPYPVSVIPADLVA
jgi:Uma2 family endonuclease